MELPRGKGPLLVWFLLVLGCLISSQVSAVEILRFGSTVRFRLRDDSGWRNVSLSSGWQQNKYDGIGDVGRYRIPFVVPANVGERAELLDGEFRIVSQPGKGTGLDVAVPIDRS